MPSQPSFSRAVIAMAALGLSCTGALAQRAEVQIEPERVNAASPDNLEQLKVLREAGRLRSIDQIEEALETPKPEKIQLTAAATLEIRPAEVALAARQSTLRVGWYYLCKKCDHWHVTVAGGYVIAEGGIAVTCHHVVLPNKAQMREGYLVAQDADGRYHPVSEVLAADARMDSVIFRIDDVGYLKPLPLNDQVGPGDTAYLLSDPKGYSGYFSSGIVNRFYWAGANKGDTNSYSDVRNLRINVSTDWAPGSSGSPVLDGRGNVIGHVSKIRTETAPAASGSALGNDVSEDKRPSTRPSSQPGVSPLPGEGSRGNAGGGSAGTQIVLHEGIAVRAVQLQVKRMNEEASSPSTRPVSK